MKQPKQIEQYFKNVDKFHTCRISSIPIDIRKICTNISVIGIGNREICERSSP